MYVKPNIFSRASAICLINHYITIDMTYLFNAAILMDRKKKKN